MNKATRLLARYKALAPDERRAFTVAAAGLPLIWAALKMLGLSRTHAWLERSSGGGNGPQITAPQVRALAGMIASAAHHTPFPSTCLTRSLLLHWMLRRRGVASELRIGVRVERPVLKAHAWVEVAGIPVNDDADIVDRFAPFSELAPGNISARYD